MMQYISLDLILFCLFLGLNLFLGLRAGRSVKTIRQYAIGHKNFSTGTLASTIIATWIGGELLFSDLEMIYTTGLRYIIAALGACICLVVMGQLAYRMKEFLKNLSVAEAMGDLYGKKIRIITAISGILAGIGFLAMQLQVTNRMLSFIFGFKNEWGVVLAGLIVIVYSAFGGIRAVTITDVFQFITFFIFLPILTFVIWNHIQNPQEVISVITKSPLYSFQDIIKWDFKSFYFIALFLFYIIPKFSPSIFQRFAMAKDIKQVKYSFNYAGVMCAIIVLILAFLAILLRIDNPNLDPSQLINHIVNTYAYPGLRGLIAVGIIAMAMSTADSELNAAAVVGINDIIKPLKYRYKPSITHVRIFAVCIGIFSLVLALKTQNLLKLLLLSASFYMPVVTVSFLLAIFGFRSTPKSVLIGMVSGISTVIIWNIFFAYTGINSVIPGFFSNLLFFLSSHYILKQKGGWVGIKENAPLVMAKIARQRFWKNVKKNITNPKPYTYLKQNLPAKEIFYTLFGIYMLGATYGSFFLISEEIQVKYSILYKHIYHVIIIISSIFITYPAWPSTFKSKRFIAFAWPTALFFVLFIIGGILLILSGFHEVQMFIFLLNIVLVALLLEWPLWIGMLVLGWILAKAAFMLYIGEIPEFMSSEKNEFRFIYSIPLFSIFIIALIRFRQAKKGIEADKVALMLKNNNMSKDLLKSYQDSYKFAKKFQEAGANKLYQIATLSQQLTEDIQNGNVEEKIVANMKILDSKIRPLAYHLDQLESRALRYLKLDITKISIKKLTDKVENQLKQYRIGINILWKIVTKQEHITCDVEKIVKMLVNSIVFTNNLHPNYPLIIVIQDTKLGYDLDAIRKNYKKIIPALAITLTAQDDMPNLDPVYKSKKGSLVEIVKIDEFPLMNNERIIQAHYGYSHTTLGNEQKIYQIYVIPQNIQQVRPKELDITDPLIKENIVLEETASAKAQEKDFLKEIKKYPIINIEKIKQAISIIKQYHCNVKRKSGEAFYLHSLSVAKILLDYRPDQDTVIAALLHDTVEDTPMSLEQITVLFNRNVARMVEGVTHLSAENDPELYRVKLLPEENIQKLLYAGDSHILCIKLADRLHNMMTIEYKPLKSQKRKAEETLLFFVPLARQLQFDKIAEKLYDVSCKVLSKQDEE